MTLLFRQFTSRFFNGFNHKVFRRSFVHRTREMAMNCFQKRDRDHGCPAGIGKHGKSFCVIFRFVAHQVQHSFQKHHGFFTSFVSVRIDLAEIIENLECGGFK